MVIQDCYTGALLHRWSRTLSYGTSLFQSVLFPLPSVFRLPYLISINCSHLATLCVRDHHIPPSVKSYPSSLILLFHLLSFSNPVHIIWNTFALSFGPRFKSSTASSPGGFSSFLFKPAALQAPPSRPHRHTGRTQGCAPSVIHSALIWNSHTRSKSAVGHVVKMNIQTKPKNRSNSGSDPLNSVALHGGQE